MSNIGLLARMVHFINWHFPLPRGRWALARFANKWLDVSKPQIRATIYGGLQIDLLLEDTVDYRIYFNLLDKEVADCIKARVFSESVVYDIGANIGFFTLLLCNSVGAQGKVYAFEPNPQVADRLCSHLTLNKLAERATVLRLALSDEDSNGSLTLYDTNNHGLSSLCARSDLAGSHVACEIRRLDTLVENQIIPPPGFIKIDVEGAEPLVLKGGEKTIATHHPTIIVEVHPLQTEFYDWPPTKWCSWANDHSYKAIWLPQHGKPCLFDVNYARRVSEGNLLLLPK